MTDIDNKFENYSCWTLHGLHANHEVSAKYADIAVRFHARVHVLKSPEHILRTGQGFNKERCCVEVLGLFLINMIMYM